MSQYYQGILQLRQPTEDVVAFAEKAIDSAARRKVTLSKVKTVRNGLDYYLSSNTFVVELCRKLQAAFGGELKISRKLHSRDRQTGRDLYRVNALFRPPLLRKGDCIIYAHGVLRVTSVDKRVHGVDALTGKTRSIPLAAGMIPLQRHHTIVSRTRPRLEVLHPETFQSVPAYGVHSARQGARVEVVLADGVYLV